MAWEDAFESHDTIRVGLLDAAEESGVNVGKVIAVSVSCLDYAGVDACRVAVPVEVLEVLNNMVK